MFCWNKSPEKAYSSPFLPAVLPEKAERFLRSCEVFCEGFFGLQERAFEAK
nr:MAG TPA: hypothetical protein [Caudoviricetes sp.]